MCVCWGDLKIRGGWEEERIGTAVSPNIPQGFAGVILPSGNSALMPEIFHDPPVLQLSSTGTVRREPVYLLASTWPKSQTPVPHSSSLMVKSGAWSWGRRCSRKVGVPIAKNKGNSDISLAFLEDMRVNNVKWRGEGCKTDSQTPHQKKAQDPISLGFAADP